jgi:glycerophosphoryl diester phosphodiesterase
MRARYLTSRLLIVTVTVAGCAQNSSSDRQRPGFEVIAHRGVHPYYYGEHEIDRRTGCSATLLREAKPSLIENTLSSMDSAFHVGADRIEIDLHRTSDHRLVVFHDARLECRTNGRGSPESFTLARLKELDAGYGYTSDGKAFPFRGRGVGQIPSLREVLIAFPEGRFLLDDKVGAPEMIARELAGFPVETQHRISYWGPVSRYEAIRSEVPAIGWRLMTLTDMEACRNALVLRLNIGAMPAVCRGGALILPTSALRRWIVRSVLGWPERFLAKVHQAGGMVFVETDSLEEAVMLRNDGVDGILTDRIEVLGPALKTDARPLLKREASTPQRAFVVPPNEEL